MTDSIDRWTAGRYVLWRQGLWPGRRWQGSAEVARCLRQIEAIQIGSINVIGRSHDIALWSRIDGYQPGCVVIDATLSGELAGRLRAALDRLLTVRFGILNSFTA